MAQEHYVEFVGVEKSYDGHNLVVQGLDLSIAKGEFLTMLGPSGSGKTTCLMMLAGFEAPSRGDIRLAGRSIQNVPPHRRNIGMVFQNYALFPHLTVGENLAYPLQARKLARADIATRVNAALDMVQMRRLGDRRPSQLSGGQQQRVALARALVFEPDLVLMDEPLGALDKNLREHLQLEIKHLQGRLGVTVVYVTHDQSEALTMSDRIAVFNAGRIEQLASPAVLYERPETAFVAEFIGENNRLEGTVSRCEGDACFVVRDDGGAMIAPSAPRGSSRVGTRVAVSVRPERVRIGDDAQGLTNMVDGDVTEIIYLGDHIRLHLALPAGGVLVAKIPNKSGRPAVRPGERVSCGWAAEDSVILSMAQPTPPRSGIARENTLLSSHDR